MSIRPAKTALGLSVVLLIALCCLLASAQSGRRQTKPPPSAPVPSPTPEPTPISTPKREEDLVVILVATGDRATTISNYPLTFHEAATLGCAERLRERTSANIDVAQRDLSRGEAIKKAKADKFTYVVLVTLIEDRMSAGTTGYVELEVDYVVFAPSTAKVLASGRTYENSARKGPLSIPRSRGATLPSYREQMLRRAGEDAADRILKVLNLDSVPPTK